MSAPDRRAPLVIDVRELHRRAGSMMEIQVTVPAPDNVANAMIGIPEGSDVALDLMAEAVVEGVLVSGDVAAQAVGSCSRCLEPMSLPLTFRVQELFRHPDAEEADDESPTFEDELIDLEATVRDGAVLELPLAPLCSDDCRGLCSQCGVSLNENPDHQHEQFDDRWAALRDLLTDEATEGRTPKDAAERRDDEEAG